MPYCSSFCLAAALLALVAGQAWAACSNASLNGTYGLLINGQNAAKMPVAGLYLLKADGAGNATGTGMQNQGSGAVPFTFSATYTVAPTCTGSVQTGSGDTLDFVLDNANADFQLIQAASGDGVTSGSGFRRGAVGCGLASIAGTFSGSGINPGAAPNGPTSFVGQITYNGKGTGTGSAVVNSAGNILTTKSTITYTVNSACFVVTTANTTVFAGSSVVANSTAHSATLVVNGGNDLLTIGTDAGPVSGSHLRK